MKLVDTTSQLSYIDSIGAGLPPLGGRGQGVGGIRDSDNSDGDCYYVFAQDHCGNISPGSNEGCIIILNAQNQQFYNTLDWNGYQTWYDGILNYNVYKKDSPSSASGGGWNLIGTTTSGSIHNFTDKDLGDSAINFCYQVEAVENPGQYNQLSRSTVACVHQDATVFIPNSFTHFNLDGLNDYFGPKGLYIKNYSMLIYNRWGELVYSTTTSKPWDGTFKGAEALEGVYIYLITIEDYNAKKSRFNGNVTIFK
jgi:gliding motility-associated-like protein